ncbi:ISAs1 family transposase [Thiocystis violascens]|uniref:Transposase n=2 Tax=Thiocystis violascens (strain ATCC 17096 / DSM 198 / 6111) TaxID=765911 RepID=G4DT07_THIV6|nr:ISAs1 family transposase [Thiocystis violascens]AFL72492.1 transposase [Thiocystis violascens DSM 198]AFL72652.1 transposase [Thiocystis violascens DSM 198]AFL73324.1 transposase [Thiocystis violascens DSM 198]AFL73425.1 transposase [Thiocystis violascens DSM 198]AFL73465.1 transposase [Thiocystis violascens DSM 198]
MCDLSVERSIAHHFAPLDEPRSAIQRRHLLSEMIVITIAASFSGADGWVGVETFGQAKEAWLRTFLKLPAGIPSHDTFGRVFALIDPAQFAACFRQWSASVAELIPEEIIAVDGKTLRRSHSRGKGLAALHLVSAWATANRVVLGQVATDAKSNEITAIPRLLEWLKLEGCIVTIDAMGCQTKIAAQIIHQGGDYVLALKGNQETLAAEVEEAFIDADARGYAGVDSAFLETVERGHGRLETRRYQTLGDLSGVPHSASWEAMNMIGMVESRREVAGKVSVETRYFIGSIGTSAARFAHAVRGHWGIENGLHWNLDIAFREDECRVRDPVARENLAVLRHLALSRLKNDGTKLGIQNKRLKAGWDESYLSKLLFESPQRKGDADTSVPANVSSA